MFRYQINSQENVMKKEIKKKTKQKSHKLPLGMKASMCNGSPKGNIFRSCKC